MGRSMKTWRKVIAGVIAVALLISTLRFLSLGARDAQERREDQLSNLHLEKLHHINRTLEFLRSELSQLETRLSTERLHQPERVPSPPTPAPPRVSGAHLCAPSATCEITMPASHFSLTHSSPV